jgi:hypothetical protein
MSKELARGIKTRFAHNPIAGKCDAQSLDDLIRIKYELNGGAHVLTSEIIETMKKEFLSKELLHVLKSVCVRPADYASLKRLTSILHNVPDNLYYFLWSLRNSDVVPVEGVINSFQLRKALFFLIKFLLILETFLRRVPKSIPIYENLGFVHLDLAGLARYSPYGLRINGRHLPYTTFLRKAVTSFQIALNLEGRYGREFDACHLSTLRLVNESFAFKNSRINLYLNPWYFLYISSALQQLNDKEGAEVYLREVRLILNTIRDHHNPKIAADQELLEAVYTALKYGNTMKFDFDGDRLERIQKKLKRIKVSKQRANGKRSGYSPLVEGALSEQYRLLRALVRQGLPNAEQLHYLQSILILYEQKPSATERDKLIFRLNIPPLKIRGKPASSFKGVLSSAQPAVAKRVAVCLPAS